MPKTFRQQLPHALSSWWREQARAHGIFQTASLLIQNLWRFALDSTPSQRRKRYGDMEYDWQHRVNTTSGAIGWRERLIGIFHSPYQPTDPALFREMIECLITESLLTESLLRESLPPKLLPIKFEDFTFVDVGSGKGRTLLMASEYRFRKIVGVELIAELHRAAEENILAYHSATQRCSKIESVCADACDFTFPDGPLVLYLFNPLPEPGLRRLIAGLEKSLGANPRPLYLLYHNPLLEHVIGESAAFVRVGGSERFAIYSAR